MKFFTTLLLITHIGMSLTAEILMVTMGGTKSHKIPFWELSRGLINRGHNITFLNGFTPDFSLNGLHEITPSGLVDYIHNYTNWDLLGARMAGKMPVSAWDVLRYPFQSCEAMLEDEETKELLYRTFDLAILDGAFPECALGLVYKLKIPFMFINTVAFYTGALSVAGNPTPFSITPAFYAPISDNMNFLERISNAGMIMFAYFMHKFVAMPPVHMILKQNLGMDVPHPYEIGKNVSFILQNGHFSVTYPRPFLPNVAEVACIHCKPAKPLPKDLEDFVNSSGDTGFIYISMGSSVKAANMPEKLRKLLVKTFARLPYHVLWKWESSITSMHDLPTNIKLRRWLPQQDILGHKKLRAFITHGGLLSMFESVYHGVPIVSIPVFCDHDANAFKAELDGYALVLKLEQLTSDQLYRAINRIIHDPKYKENAKIRQKMLLDQRTTPLETAVYWTEYVLRHKGAYHLQSPGRNLNWIQYYLVDIVLTLVAAVILLIFILKRLLKQLDFIRFQGTKQKKL
ncbi:UDP-glucosyltransferase 2 [Condylostylus longicornis]|uniref:UDP-glucosyltransferase 2 n=1 Tax=Condylostylus longicornis TaxID=2530218 RepID=UPI00244DDE48|nr:UDP-glucosyltransferase 2 [Condylostylus longicornis]